LLSVSMGQTWEVRVCVDSGRHRESGLRILTLSGLQRRALNPRTTPSRPATPHAGSRATLSSAHGFTSVLNSVVHKQLGHNSSAQVKYCK